MRRSGLYYQPSASAGECNDLVLEAGIGAGSLKLLVEEDEDCFCSDWELEIDKLLLDLILVEVFLGFPASEVGVFSLVGVVCS